MRQTLCWLVGGALCLGLDSMSMAAESGCRAEFVTADISPRSEQLLAWLKAHPPADDWNSEWKQNDSESVLFADIDNDGKEEAIVLSHGGTLHTAGIDVFRPSADGWKGVPLPPGPAFPEEDIWYDWQAVDLFENPPPVDHGAADGPAQVENGPPRTRLLARFCGKTYINLAAGLDPYPYPTTYIWEGDRTRKVCATPWLEEMRRMFKDKFDRGRYDAAHALLDGVQGFCAPEAKTRPTWLWMQSDLALTAYRMRTYDTCLRHVAAAEKSAGFAQAGQTLKRALAANAALCQAAKAKGPDTSYDFSWLRKAGDRQIVFDPRFNALLSAVAPDVHLKDPEREALRDVLRLNVWLSSIEEVDKDHLVIAGGRAHATDQVGAIWIDTASGQSIVMVNRQIVASMTIPSARVPVAAWEKLELEPGDGVDYYEPNGRWTKLTVPEPTKPHRAPPAHPDLRSRPEQPRRLRLH